MDGVPQIWIFAMWQGRSVFNHSLFVLFSDRITTWRVWCLQQKKKEEESVMAIRPSVCKGTVWNLTKVRLWEFCKCMYSATKYGHIVEMRSAVSFYTVSCLFFIGLSSLSSRQFTNLRLWAHKPSVNVFYLRHIDLNYSKKIIFQCFFTHKLNKRWLFMFSCPIKRLTYSGVASTWTQLDQLIINLLCLLPCYGELT